LLGAAGAAVVGTPLRGRAGAAGWVDVGPLARFVQGEAVKVVALGERRDGWQRFPSRPLGGVLIRREGEAVEALSSVCPHNGCDVFVDGATFLCPCHDSRFAADGALVEGESPRGLDPLEVRVREGRVEVRYQRFEVGTAERRPL
jgi:nitrite reductase/ring-hydroxylating ferredoxin subunit